MGLLPGVENINWSPLISQTIYWTGWVLMAITILVILYVAFNLTNYTIKATVFPLYGSGKDGIFSVGKPKENRIRWISNKTAWKPLKPYFNKITMQPFDAEFIYPNKRIFAFELGNQWMPGRINITRLAEGVIRAAIDPIPSYLRNWEIITHKQIDMELQSEDWWDKNKHIFMSIVVVLICCILCGATVYFTYKFATGGTQAMNQLSEAIKNIVNVKGI